MWNGKATMGEGPPGIIRRVSVNAVPSDAPRSFSSAHEERPPGVS